MSLYRVKQFAWAIKSLVEEVDMKYINKFLNKEEIILFKKLKKSEQQHCIRVCKDAIELSKDKNMDVNKVAKVALLHDIGKSEYGLNVIEKSILVILHKASDGKIKKYQKIKPIDSYYNHATKGVDILKKYNTYDKEFLDAVRYHHDYKQKPSELLEIIRESDNKN